MMVQLPKWNRFWKSKLINFYFYQYRVIVTSQTWDRECHGLYDFDIQNLDKIENTFVGCGYVQRNK